MAINIGEMIEGQKRYELYTKLIFDLNKFQEQVFYDYQKSGICNQILYSKIRDIIGDEIRSITKIRDAMKVDDCEIIQKGEIK